MRVARIKDNKVINVELWDVMPIAEGFTFIDVTNLGVGPGDTYSPATKKFTKEAPQDTRPLTERLSAIFENSRDSLPPEARIHFRLLQAAIQAALEATPADVDAAKAGIQGAKMPDGTQLPPALAAIQTKLLAEFDNV